MSEVRTLCSDHGTFNPDTEACACDDTHTGTRCSLARSEIRTLCNDHGDFDPDTEACTCDESYVGVRCAHAKTELSALLAELGIIDDVIGTLAREDFDDLETLRGASVSLLRELGISAGHAIKIMRALDNDDAARQHTSKTDEL